MAASHSAWEVIPLGWLVDALGAVHAPSLLRWIVPIDELGHGTADLREDRRMTATSANPVESESAPIFGLSPSVSVVPYGDDEIFVRSGSRSEFSKVVRDPDRRRLLVPLLQLVRSGPLPVAGMAEALGAHESDVESLVEQLAEERILLAVGDQRSRRVLVAGDGGVARSLAELLRSDGIATVDITSLLGDDADLDEIATDLLVFCSDVRHPSLEHELNLWAMERGTPFMRVCTDGDEVLVGPIVLPGQTACLNCYDVQDEATRNFRFDYLTYKKALDDGSRPLSSARAQALAAGYAATAVADIDGSGWSFLVERVIHVNLSNLEITTDRIFRIPRCPVCIRHRADLRHTFL